MPLLELLDNIDKALFALIQHDTDSSILDAVTPWLRNPFTWIPLYAFMLYYISRKGKNKAIPFILLSILTFALTDSITAQLLKPLFGRLRPCHDPEMSSMIKDLVSCGGAWSMPSNHAANHFGLAAFWYFSIRDMDHRRWNWLWIWAAAICYAQVYVGKHYPFDILVGAALGFLTGLGMSRLFAYWKNRQGHSHRLPIFDHP